MTSLDVPRTAGRLLVAIGAALVLAVALPSAAAAADGSPCRAAVQHATFGPVQYCPLWMPSRGTIPVHHLDGGRVTEAGRIVKAGSVNWFVCQTDRVGGRAVRHRDAAYPAYTNVWWARTLSDTGAWGWTSEVYFSGGGNDEPDGGLRRCSAAEAAVTGNPATAPPAAPAPAPAAPAAPSRLPLVLQDGRPCQGGSLRTGQGVAVRYRLHDRFLDITSQMSMGAPVIRDIWKRAGWIGDLYVRAATCRTAQGWRILPDALIATASAGLDGVGRPRGRAPERGWGIDPRGASNGTISVAATRCYAKGSPWPALKFALGLPLPTRYWVSVLTWAAGNAVPDRAAKLNCRQLGLTTLRLGVSSRGLITARATSLGPEWLRLGSSSLWSTYTVTPFVTLGRNLKPPGAA